MTGAFFPGIHVLLQIVLRTGVIYLLVLIGVRLSGKREVGQMTPFDLTLLLLLSNSVQNAMTGPDTSLLGGAVAASYAAVAELSGRECFGRKPALRRLIEGEPSLLVHDGKVIDSHMAREHVSMDELNRALREHGINSCDQVALAVLEVDGSISCLKYDEIKPDANTHLARRKGIQRKRSRTSHSARIASVVVRSRPLDSVTKMRSSLDSLS